MGHARSIRTTACTAGALGLVLGAVTGCGSGGATAIETVPVTAAATQKAAGAEPDFSGCPEGRSNYKTGKSIVAEGEGGVEEGAEVRIAEEDIRLGEKMERQAVSGCKVERGLARREAKICANTPRQLEEAFALEETKGNAGYIGIYEATCGKRVNVP